MYKPEHVGSVTDTEGREIAFSVDHGTVRLDLLGAVVFLEHEPAVHAVVMLRETREIAFSVDHGTVRLDLLGAVVFLEHEPAVHAVVMLRETRELARTRREEEAGG